MIITIAGQIGSGKTTLASAIAGRTGASMAGFGDFVRMKAHDQGLDDRDRSVLQDFGESLVAADAAGFLHEVLRWAGHKTGNALVLDGLRHASVWNVLRARQAQGLDAAKLVYLVVDDQERRRRLLNRGLTAEAITAADAHPTEQNLRRHVRDVADIILNADCPPDEMAERATAQVARSPERGFV